MGPMKHISIVQILKAVWNVVVVVINYRSARRLQKVDKETEEAITQCMRHSPRKHLFVFFAADAGRGQDRILKNMAHHSLPSALVRRVRPSVRLSVRPYPTDL